MFLKVVFNVLVSLGKVWGSNPNHHKNKIAVFNCTQKKKLFSIKK